MKENPFHTGLIVFVPDFIKYYIEKINLHMFPISENLQNKSFVLLMKCVIMLFFSINMIGQNDFYQSNGTPDNMIDKSTLRPSVGSFSSDVTAISEDLNRGKVNVNIPLFDFEYFDYKIPVSINNNYPQELSNNIIEGKPFYLNSRVGGDWTLSIDQFKVSRQLNGNEDENPNKGYFSSFSQSRVNNISNITNSDVINGLKGNWDPSIDIFHFSTPTVSGSFLINLIDGTFRNLTDSSFNVKYTRNTNSITSFTVTDDKGNQYLFGGDDTSIEISQSKTGVTSYGTDLGGGKRLKYIVEFKDNGTFATYSSLGNSANLYSYNAPQWAPITIVSPEEIMQTITMSGFNLNSGYLNYRAVYLGNNCYGIPADFQAQNRIVELPGNTDDDSDLRREKVNTAWYLREIKLINGKKIIFNYQNSWIAYKTFAANKVELNSSGVNYTYIGLNGVQKTLNAVKVYTCMPQSFSTFQFPINESYSGTTNFIKSPQLIQIYDEDFISQIEMRKYKGNPPYLPENDRVIRPYVVPPSFYPNAPQETINGGNVDPSLIKGITYYKNNQTFLEIDFANNSTIYSNNGIRYPENDFSTLNELVINNSKKYIFTNIGSRLSKIKYPTGAIKEFYSKEVVGSVGDFSLYGNVNLHSGRVTDSIVTISENNKTTEKYIYSSPFFHTPPNVTYKTFRPDITTCTALAMYTSTNRIYNNRATKNGLYFKSAKKYINNDLVVLSELYNVNYGENSNLYMTNGSTPNPSIETTSTLYEQKALNLKKTTQYKKDVSNQFVKQSTSDLAYSFTTGSLEFPCVYLANIEAGPWSNTSGAIRRGYSRYYYPTGVESDMVTKTDSVFFDNNKVVKNISISYFKRYFHSLGTNVRKLEKTKAYESGNVWETKYINVNGTDGFINYDSPLFQSMRKNNISPDLVTIVSKNDNVISLNANKYKLLSINSGIPVVESQKRFEANTTDLNNIIGVSFNTSDPNNLTYDSRYKDIMIYDKYDINGRLIEYYKPNGNHTSIIWGYKDNIQ